MTHLSFLISELADLQELQPGESPEKYRVRVGKCPPGMHWDGAKCRDAESGKVPQPATNAPAAAAAPPAAKAEPAAPAAPPEKKGFFAKAKEFALSKLKAAKTDAQTVAAATKDFHTKAKDFVQKAPDATKAFFTDPGYRKAALGAMGAAAKAAPKKLADRAVKVAKDEVHEWKTAGGAIKTLAQKKSWKALDKHQKHALTTVAKHMAITVGAAVAVGSGLGIAGAAAKGMGRHLAAKVAGKAFEKLHTAEELTHLAHLFHDEAGDAETDSAMNKLGELIAASLSDVSAEDLNPTELEALAGAMADAESEETPNPQAAPAEPSEGLQRVKKTLRSVFELAGTAGTAGTAGASGAADTGSDEDPNKYYQRVGKCPPGYHFNGDKCEPADAAQEPQQPQEPAATAPEVPDLEPPKAAPAQEPGDEIPDLEPPPNVPKETWDSLGDEEKRIAGDEETRRAKMNDAANHGEEYEDAAVDDALSEVEDEYDEDEMDDILDDDEAMDSEEGKSKVGGFLTALAGVLALGALSAVFPAGLVLAVAGAYVAKKAADKLFSDVTESVKEAEEDRPRNSRDLAAALQKEVVAQLRQGIPDEEMQKGLAARSPAPTAEGKEYLTSLIAEARDALS